jgi:hypothetical protein
LERVPEQREGWLPKEKNENFVQIFVKVNAEISKTMFRGTPQVDPQITIILHILSDSFSGKSTIGLTKMCKSKKMWAKEDKVCQT